MISTALEYANTMRKLNIAENIVGQTEDILKAVPQILIDFENPVAEPAPIAEPTAAEKANIKNLLEKLGL